MESPRFRFRRWVLPAALSLALMPALPLTSRAENHAHHIGLALGYQKLLSDDLKDDSIGLDFTNAGFANISYRYSLLPNLDLALDLRGTASVQTVSGVDLSLLNSFFGPGVRLVSPNEGARPFVQANFFLVDEEIELERNGTKVSFSENGVGFGVCAGVDLRASNLISIPIEANYMYGKPSDDVSGIGINVGITFNFGTMRK